MTAGDALRDAYYASREALREYPDLRRFRRFYAGLPTHQDVFYVFFTSGMLMWLRTCLRFTPRDVNIVLIGSGLTADEQRWVETWADRPAFFTGVDIDDKSCWRWLFDVNERSFGWLDVDCFVLQPRLFAEMAEIRPGELFNTIWSYPVHDGLRLLNTFFLFVNIDAVHALRRTRLRLSPMTYTVRPSTRGRHRGGAWSRVLSRRQTRLLERVWPRGEDGVLTSPYDGYWDTLKIYQLVGRHFGFGTRSVRDLHGLLLSPRSYSSEIIHIGMASHLTRASRDRVLLPVYGLHLQFRVALLREALPTLSERYRATYAEWQGELQELGIAESAIGTNIRRFFASMGLPPELFRDERWAFLWN